LDLIQVFEYLHSTNHLRWVSCCCHSADFCMSQM